MPRNSQAQGALLSPEVLRLGHKASVMGRDAAQRAALGAQSPNQQEMWWPIGWNWNAYNPEVFHRHYSNAWRSIMAYRLEQARLASGGFQPSHSHSQTR